MNLRRSGVVNKAMAKLLVWKGKKNTGENNPYRVRTHLICIKNFRGAPRWNINLIFFFRWSLYGVPWGRGYFSRQLISETEWIHKATTGSEGPHMAVDPVVARFTSNSSYSYYFSVKTWRWGTSESHCGMYYV